MPSPLLGTEVIVDQLHKIAKKVRKLSREWDKASIVGGDLTDIPLEAFETVMIDVLQTYLLYRESSNGVRGFNNDVLMEQYHFFPDDIEKALAPLVLVHLREMNRFDEQSLQDVSSQIFIVFVNLTMGSYEKLSFLKHLTADD